MRKCRGNCAGWKGMINFIYGLPKYAVADYCATCQIWYPKHSILKCPCCHFPVRGKRATFPQGSKHLKNPSKEEQCRKIKLALKDGWTLLNEDIWKSVLDFRIIHKMELEEE